MAKKLLNQSQFAKKHGIKRQRVGQIILQGDLLTEVKGRRIMIVDCKFNDDTVKDLCQGRGNWNRPRSYGGGY